MSEHGPRSARGTELVVWIAAVLALSVFFLAGLLTGHA